VADPNPASKDRSFGPGVVEVVVLTTSAGPLARLGHDLSFRVARLQVDLAADAASAEVVMQADSLELLSPVNGRDRADILKRLRKDVLRPDRYPEIRYSASRISQHGEGEHATLTVNGELTLCGRTRPLRIDLVRDRKDWGGKVVIRQPDYGIKPFKVLIGGLRVAPEITIQLRVPATDP